MFILVLSLVLIFLGFTYLNRPKKVFRINAILRQTLFNDAYISLHRRTLGIILLLLGLVIFGFKFLC